MTKSSKLFLFIFCWVFICPVYTAYSQAGKIDSLQLVLKSSRQDTNRVNILNKLSEEFDGSNDLDNAVKYANAALNLARKINNLKGVAKALDNLGNAYCDQGNNAEALKKYTTSLSVKKEIGNKKELAYTYNLIGNVAPDNDEALKYYSAALQLNAEINYKKAMATNYNNIGIAYYNKGDYVRALDNYLFALKLNEELGNKPGIALDYSNIGSCYMYQGNYTEALNNQLAALKINEELGDKTLIARNYNNIGIVYKYQLNYKEALENYYLSLKLAKEAGDKTTISNIYVNIGNVYEEQGNYQEALKNQFLSLKINEELQNNAGIAANYSNIGVEFKKQGNFSEALNNYFKALKIYEDIADKNNIANAYINIGSIYIKQNKKEEASKYFNLGLVLSKEIGNKYRIKESYNAISLLDSTNANWKSAYDNNKLYYVYRDSLINESNSKKLLQSQMEYNYGKKELKEKLEQEKKNVLIAEEKHQQRIILISISIGLVIVIAFSFLLYNRFKLTVKQKQVIELQKQEVEAQKELVEEKNKEVTDSINYAKRIQTALMPSDKTIKENLPDSFLLYMPKDIVAGDFYWLEKIKLDDVLISQYDDDKNVLDIESAHHRINNQNILFAACDCTGHGVPGALVSVVCNNALNRAVREFNLTQPAAILDKTEEIVTENFAKNELAIKDGMDVSLVSLRYDSSKPDIAQIEWAGANNPIWMVRKTSEPEPPDYELIEIKADKQAIGINENQMPFTNHSFTLQKNETLYIFSDGFADQFGGESGRKKITRKRFKALIVSIQDLSMEEQKAALESFFFEFKRDVGQIDDILVMGVRV